MGFVLGIDASYFLHKLKNPSVDKNHFSCRRLFCCVSIRLVLCRVGRDLFYGDQPRQTEKADGIDDVHGRGLFGGLFFLHRQSLWTPPTLHRAFDSDFVSLQR